ncbi:MAG: glycosyl hydrolase family 28-related protein [Limisphaerales bacterium]
MRLTIASACVFLFFAISLQAADGSKVFDVRRFGAKGDGQTLDTAAIQKALDECGQAAGGTVKFSRGTYYSKPLTLQAKTTVLLEAGATLLACTNQQ